MGAFRCFLPFTISFWIVLSYLCASTGRLNALCDNTNNYDSVQEAARRRDIWTSNITFEIEALLNSARPRGTELRESNPYLPHDHSRFDAIGPVGPTCRQLESFGEGDFEKRVCSLQSAINQTDGCVIISIGSNNQWSFEEAVFSKAPGCVIHTFDCTVSADADPPEYIRSRVTLHRYCIGASSDLATSFMSWDHMLRHIGIDHAPTWLKLDIEGYEWEILPVIARSRHSPVQISAELHYQTQMRALSWYGRYKTETEIALLAEHMVHRRYFFIDRHDNIQCPHCSEVLLSRVCV